jgi:hypothetical protein
MTAVSGAKSARLLLVAAVVACLSVPAVAVAQGYPPPQPTPKKTPKPKPKCNTPGVFKKSGKKTVFKAKTEFQRGEKMAVKGEKGCARSGKKVKLVITTHNGPNIGTGTSSESGAYTVRGTIPKTIKTGKHRLEAWTSGKEYPAAIKVVSSSRGGSSRRSFFSSTPMLAAWVALGAFLVAFFLGSRRRRRDPMLAAAADLEVPLIDTSHFVPAPVVARPRRRSGAKTTKKGSAKAAKTTPKSAGARKATKPRATKPKTEPAGRKAAKSKPNPQPKAKAATGSVTSQRKETRAPKARTAAKPRQPKNGKKT